jgi:hypothetical protein
MRAIDEKRQMCGEGEALSLHAISFAIIRMICGQLPESS